MYLRKRLHNDNIADHGCFPILGIRNETHLMKIPLIRIIWIVATLVIYLGFKIYDFNFPLIFLNLLPMTLLWFAIRKEGWNFFDGPKNYPLFLLVICSGILLEHFVYALLPQGGISNRVISIVISLAVLAAAVFSAKWFKERELQHP